MPFARPMSPREWRLAYHGRLAAATRGDGRLELDLDLPRLARRARIRLTEANDFDWRPAAHTWEDDDIVDVSAIAAAGLTIAGARWSRDGRKVVLTTSDGTILVSYGAFEAAETLTDDWRSHWNAWRESFDEPVHPLVREWLVKGKGASVDTLLETWRRERTSDLATLVDRLDAPMA